MRLSVNLANISDLKLSEMIEALYGLVGRYAINGNLGNENNALCKKYEEYKNCPECPLNPVKFDGNGLCFAIGHESNEPIYEELPEFMKSLEGTLSERVK